MAALMDLPKTTVPQKIVQRKQWDEGETFCMLNYYKMAKNELRNSKRKRLRYDEIADCMSAAGYNNRTGREVKKKMENLLKKYREEIVKIETTGRSPSQWKYFYSIHEIMGGALYHDVDHAPLKATQPTNQEVMEYLPSLGVTVKMETIPSDDENEAVEQSFVSEPMNMELFCNMNSPKPGSDAADTESVDVSTVFHSFRLEWKIPSETILDDKHVPRKLSAARPDHPTPSDDLSAEATNAIENSKWFEFKDLKIPPFCLELSCDRRYDGDSETTRTCRVKVVTQDPRYRGAVRLNYAVVVRGDRLYRLSGDALGRHHQDATLDVLRGVCREQKCLTVMCQVQSHSDVRASAGDRCANEFEVVEELECEFPSRISVQSTSSVEEAIDLHRVSGALPTLDVALAREILQTTEGEGGRFVEGGRLLRAWSAEFLARNLDDANVAGVWAFATEHRVQSLAVECGRYMAKHWKAESSDGGKKKAVELHHHKQKNFLFSNIYCSK